MKKITEEEKKKEKILYIVLGVIFTAIIAFAIKSIFFQEEKKGFKMKIAGQEFQYKEEKVFKKGNDISGVTPQSTNSDQPGDPKAGIPEKLRWDGN